MRLTIFHHNGCNITIREVFIARLVTHVLDAKAPHCKATLLTRCRRLAHQVLCTHLVAWVTFPHLVFESFCPQAGRQSASALFTDHGLPSLVSYVWSVLTEVDRVRSSVVFHQSGCDVKELEAFFPALPVAHEFGLMPPSRIAYRTWNKAQLRLALACVHLHWSPSPFGQQPQARLGT